MKEIFDALSLNAQLHVVGDGAWPSCFRVTDLAIGAVGGFGAAIAELQHELGLSTEIPSVEVDRRLASLWFQFSISPVGWQLPPVWDDLAGLYETRDGWIRLHTNIPAHRAAAVNALGVADTKEAVQTAVRRHDKEALETAIVDAGGAAAAMNAMDEWERGPQGSAIASEPLIWRDEGPARAFKDWRPTPDLPLNGLRVLDLTRVLAGPVATRALAGFGAEVLRIDPPWWEEANVAPDITLGKRCARLDLTQTEDRIQFENLLREADLLVHGYRPGALDGLGYSRKRREEIAPHLSEVSLCAYGWTGPWSERRGFDSLVQMSAGIAHAGMVWAGSDKPTPLPVQALDHATGWLMAAAAVKSLADAKRNGRGGDARVSLARTAHLLAQYEQRNDDGDFPPARESDFAPTHEATPWGAARRLLAPLRVGDAKMRWARGACEFGAHEASWSNAR